MRVLKNFANLTGKHLCWNLFLIKLQVSRPATLLKRDSKILLKRDTKLSMHNQNEVELLLTQKSTKRLRKKSIFPIEKPESSIYFFMIFKYID